MFIYNLSIYLLFWTLAQFISSNFKTLYSFSDFKLNFFFCIILTVLFFSLAGIPPFLGFFSKILILVSLIDSNFFFLYVFFFILLFFGLYFYLQNIKFLYSSNFSVLNYSFMLNIRISTQYLLFSSFLIFFLLLVFFFWRFFFFFFLNF